MDPRSDYQREVREFITVRVKQAFDEIAEAINQEPECIATVESKLPPNRLARVTLIVRAPAATGKLAPIFGYTVDGVPEYDSARVRYSVYPAKVNSTYKDSEEGDLQIPSVPVATDATAQQIRDYVRPLAEAAIEGYRVRQYHRRERS